MNFIKKFFLIKILLIILIYTVNITNIPKKIIIFENENLKLGEIFGLKIKEEKNKIIETSSSSNKIENKSITVSLFNIIPVKKVDVTTIQDTKIIPLGNTIGIKIYSSGVLVIGMTEIEGKKPYENTGIKEGDLIIKIDNIEVNTTEELIECVNKSQGQNVEVKYLRVGT